MPTENIYPDNWTSEIRPRILERATNKDGIECCEKCGAENRRWVWYHPSADSEPAMMDIWTQDVRQAVQWYGAYEDVTHENPPNGYLVCLTIAHLADPDPMNCEGDNLAALCNTCHLRYDAKMKANNIKLARIQFAITEYGQLSLW